MLLFIEIAAFIDTIIIHSTMSITQMLERQKFGEYETIVPLKRTSADLFSVFLVFWYVRFKNISSQYPVLGFEFTTSASRDYESPP